MKQFLIISFLFFLIIPKVLPQCSDKITAFQAGEKTYYNVYYNWGFIWLNAGEAFFEIIGDKYEGKSALHFKSFGRSRESYDWIFKVRDYYESYVSDSNLTPYKYIRNTSEGKYSVRNTYIFDHDNKKIYSATRNSKKAYSEDTLALPDCTYDLQTAIYFARNIDYSKYNVDDKIPISMVVDNEMIELYIRYKGKETIKTKEGHMYKCFVFTAMMMEGSIFKEGENVTVWVTDDGNKIPVLIEAKILVGSVKAYLAETEGLRHKMTARQYQLEKNKKED